MVRPSTNPFVNLLREVDGLMEKKGIPLNPFLIETNGDLSLASFKKKFLVDSSSLELIDVREPSEFKEAHIKGSKLIPMGEIEKRLHEIDWSKEVIFICRSGGRSGYVTDALKNAGYAGKSLAGGIQILSMNCSECME